MTTLEFRDPPASARGSGPSSASHHVASTLKAHPGEWAFVGTRSPSYRLSIAQARTRAFEPAGSFEAVIRNTANGRADIYARYVGANREFAS